MTDTDDNLATAPISHVIKSIREFNFPEENLLLELYLNIMANRLEQEHDRANKLQELIDDCPYSRCPCR